MGVLYLLPAHLKIEYLIGDSLEELACRHEVSVDMVRLNLKARGVALRSDTEQARLDEDNAALWAWQHPAGQDDGGDGSVRTVIKRLFGRGARVRLKPTTSL